MKFLLTFVFVALIINGTVFNIFAFFNVTYNIGYWSQDSRFVCSLLFLVGFVCSFFVAAIEAGKINLKEDH